MVVPNRTLRPHIVIQASRYQVTNWRLAKPSSRVKLTLSEGFAFRKAHEWCIERNAAASISAYRRRSGQKPDTL